MTLLVVGLSHRTAPIEVLEGAVRAVGEDGKLAAEAAAVPAVVEAAVLDTCNRVEVYADVTAFHAAVAELTDLLAVRGGIAPETLRRHVYVHYQDRVVQHLFGVACGLDSMVVGEQQVVAQVRAALHGAERHGTLGRALGDLFRHALRTGKRARAETRIDAAGASLVGVAVNAVAAALGDTAGGTGGDTGGDAAGSLAGRRVLVVGAGAMSGLAVATLVRAGAGSVVVANRTRERADRLATAYGVAAAGLADLPAELAAADAVVTCTGAVTPVVTSDLVSPALAGRAGRPLVLADLALPRDVDPAVGDLPGVTLLGLAALAAASEQPEDVAAARRIVAHEVDAFRRQLEQARVAPTVTALRDVAGRIVSAELDRLRTRVPDLDGRTEAEVERTVHRVVEKLLHTPTVRVKQLSTTPGGGSYAAALRELFDLDPAAPEAMTRLDLPGDGEPDGAGEAGR